MLALLLALLADLALSAPPCAPPQPLHLCAWRAEAAQRGSGGTTQLNARTATHHSCWFPTGRATEVDLVVVASSPVAYPLMMMA